MPEAKDDLKREKVRIVPISNIEDFPDHPFQVKDDESMDQLVESIRMNGVLNPVIALKIDENHYQLISGHRRKRACMLLGITRIPRYPTAKSTTTASPTMRSVWAEQKRSSERTSRRSTSCTSLNLITVWQRPRSKRYLHSIRVGAVLPMPLMKQRIIGTRSLPNSIQPFLPKNMKPPKNRL